MGTTPGAAAPLDVTRVRKERPKREVVMRVVQPVSTVLVRVLARLGVDPQAVVLSHGVLGVVAAALVVVGSPGAFLAAALLLQVRTVLDNADGGLARATGRVTRNGRYLDSVLDTLVNGVLLVAVGLHAPAPAAAPLAVVAFAVLMLVLTLDYHLERRYTALRRPDGAAAAGTPPGARVGVEPDAPIGAPERVYGLVKGLYETLLAPQDRAAARVDDWLFARAFARSGRSLPDLEHRLAWSDLYSTATLVNLGQSTQMVVLGACLALGAPFAYVWILLAQAGYVALVQSSRVARFRRYLHTP